MYRTKYLEKPCRNFCILGAAGFQDPKDGLSKVACVSFANFDRGVLLLIEPRSNTAEGYVLPANNGSWAVFNHNNQELIIGTCADGANIHCFDLLSRRFTDSIRVEGETYIWDLVDGRDGYLYGGTYNGGRLIRYSLNERRIEDLGHLGENDKNLYVQNVRYVPGFILADAGRAENETFAFCQKDQRIYPLKAVENRIDLDKAEGKPDFHHCRLPDGSVVCIDGQEYLFYEPDSAEGIRRRLPGEPPATAILALCSDGKGKIWGSTNFGMTFFNYDTKTGAFENSGNITTYGSGEVYGMAIYRDSIYMTSYCNGFHLRYDPAKPWDVQNNVNPRILAAIEPDYIRPIGKTVIGPQGTLWTGWLAKYGQYGGALSKIDSATGEVTVYPVGDQGVVSVAADDSRIYYVTYGEGNGLAARKGPFRLCAVDVNGNETACVKLEPKQNPYYLYTNRLLETVIVCSHSDCIFFRKDSFEIAASYPLKINYIVSKDDRLIFFGEKTVWSVDPTSLKMTEIAETKGGVRAAVVEGEAVYYCSGTELWKLEKGE